VPFLFVSTIRATDNFIEIYVESSIVPHKPQETMFNVDVMWFCQPANIAYMVLPSPLYASVGIGNVPRSPVQEMQ